MGRSPAWGSRSKGPGQRTQHWAWYPEHEWSVILRKHEQERLRREQEVKISAGPAELQPCTDIRHDGIGDLQIRDDDLGPRATQLKVVGALYTGAHTVWYHVIAAGYSRARILHVQAVDASGTWQDPTICKLSPVELLRVEAESHSSFARYIGESVPQRLGEPVYVEGVGGMVLELVGGCWRMPELAHTQAHLSNTFAELCKYESDHASDVVADPAEEHGVLESRLSAAHVEAAERSLAPPPEIASPEIAVAADGGGERMPRVPSLARMSDARRVRDRPVFGEVRIVIDEVLHGQLSTVLLQTAHREPCCSLAEHYGLLPKLSRVLQAGSDAAGPTLPPCFVAAAGGDAPSALLPPPTRESLRCLQAALQEAADTRGAAVTEGALEDYPGPWFAVVHGDPPLTTSSSLPLLSLLRRLPLLALRLCLRARVRRPSRRQYDGRLALIRLAHRLRRGGRRPRVQGPLEA